MQEKLEAILREIANLKTMFNRHEKRLDALEGKTETPSEEPTAYQAPSENVPEEETSNPTTPFDWRTLEMNIGKYFLQVAGVAVFVFGVGFLLKYSIEKGLISPTVRIAMSLVCATILLALSEYLARRYNQWAQGCIAGSVVIFYLSFYAAYGLYNLISLPTAFGFCSAVSILTVGLALRHNSIVIATFSVIGGFITPLFLSLGQNALLFVAMYLFALALGFLLLSYLKGWFFLSFLSFIGLLINYSFPSSFDKLSLNNFLLFMIVWFFIYSLVPYLHAFVTKHKNTFASWMIPLNTLSVFSILVNKLDHFGYDFIKDAAGEGQFQLVPGTFDASPAFVSTLFKDATQTQILTSLSFIFGGLCLIGLVALFLRDKENLRLQGSLLLLTIGLFATAIVTKWHGLVLVNVLHLYALLLFMLGLVLRRRFIRILAYCFWLLSLELFLVASFVTHQEFSSLIWNQLNGSFALIFVIFLVSALASYKNKALFEKQPLPVPEILASGAILTVVIWMLSPIWQSPHHIIGLAWYAFILFVLGLIVSSQPLRIFGYAIQGFALAHFFFRHEVLFNAASHLNYLIITASFIAIFISAFALTFRYASRFGKNEHPLISSLSSLLAGFFIWTGGRALILFSRPVNDNMLPTNQTNAILTIYYGLYALSMTIIGFFIQKTIVRFFGLALICLTLGKLWFIIMAMRETEHRIITFIAIGILITLASFVYQKMSRKK